MRMRVLFSLIVVFVLIGIAIIGAQVDGLRFLFGIIIPYLAILVFLGGFVYRVVNWAKSPVPFKIPTTCGQQKSLPWIKDSRLESPNNTLDVILRMALEVLFFRSLFRNTKQGLKDGPKLVYGSNKWLWLGGMVFHWSFLVILLRHFKFFTNPAPFFVPIIESLDGFFQVGLPLLFLTDIFILAALTYLFLRRIADAKMRYISLAADYFPLFLIAGIASTGVLMRYFTKVDLVGIKELSLGLVTFNPTVPDGVGYMFFIHLFLVCALLIYFPFSKLMHFGGIFMSPTRNMANDNRMQRHINPWNYDVKTHTYEEWEDEFREPMREAGMPLEKDK